MADRVLRTDFKRIGRSGPTVDGRVISPQQIDEMAASYDKSLYTALIWPEHQRYVNYGTVEELRATDNEEGGRDLWAVLSPNEFYTGSNHYGQKLFTSMEITPDFRKTGKAYLTGLGATDDPASAATSEVRFSKHASQAGIVLTKAVEAEQRTFEDPADLTLIEKITALFKTQNQPNSEDADMADKGALEKLSTEMAELKAMFAKLLPAGDDKKPEDKPVDLAASFAALQKSHEELVEKFKALETDSGKKPEASGGDALKELSEKFAALEARLEEALKEQPGTNGGEHFGANDIEQTDC